jgi:hypothetical protein
VTFKDILVTRGPRTGVGRRDGQDYVIEKHSALAMTVPAVRDLFTGYVMNRVLTAADGVAADALHRRADDLLVVVEHSCDDRAGFEATLQDAEYLATVRPDEIYMSTEIFSEPPTVYEVVEETVLDDAGDGASGGGGALVAIDFLRRRPGVDVAAFRAALAAEAEWLGADADYRAVARRRVHNLVQGGEGSLNPDAADLHDAIVTTVVTDFTGLAAVYDRLRARQADYVDAGSSFSALARRKVVV